MTSVQSFGSSLLPPQVKTAGSSSAPSVEDILNSTPPAPPLEQAPDTFTKSGTENAQSQSGSSFWWKLGGGTVAVCGLVMAGRKGWFGKHIQKWFGGKLSLKDVNKKIEDKMAEFLEVGEGGKVNIIKNADGTSTLRAESEGGNVQEYTVSVGKNVIKLKGKYPDCELNEEFIVFDRNTGIPKSRVNLARAESGKVEEYQAFKGSDVLNRDFDEEAGIYKEYFQSAPRRRYLFGLFGPKEVKSSTSVYTNPTTGKPSAVASKATYRDGKKVKIYQAKEGKERTIYLDGPGGKVSQIVTKTQDGKVVIEKFQYTTTPEGKIKKDKVTITDVAGNPTASIKWND